MSEWKPGDVGISEGGERFIVTGESDCFWPGAAPRSWEGVSGRPSPLDRPLVVIDYEDAEQVERLTTLMHKASRCEPGIRNPLLIALREFVRPTPRIEEPTGLGAVVADTAPTIGERLYVRCRTDTTIRHWFPADHRGDSRTWAELLPAVRILSPGVEATS